MISPRKTELAELLDRILQGGDSPESTDEAHLWTALSSVTDLAVYHQPVAELWQSMNFSTKNALAGRIVLQILSRPDTHWWSQPIDLHGQAIVKWGSAQPISLRLEGVAPALTQWCEEATGDASHGGEWWSLPISPSIVTTTRIYAGAPTEVRTREGSFGEEEATIYSVDANPSRPVLELNDGGTWIDLVNRFPLNVTESRGAAWGSYADLQTEWFQPDWRLVSRYYSGVHLSIKGYLEASGALLACDSGHSLIAGWGPDVTLWLEDCLTIGNATTVGSNRDLLT